MEKDFKKNKNNKKNIILIFLLLAIVCGLFFVFKKNTAKNRDIDGASVSGYILEDGAEPGLTEDEIRELLQRQVDE